MTFILPSFGASAISAVPGGGGGGGALTNTYSVDFDGTDDYLSLGNLGSAGRSLGSMLMWVNVTSTNGIHSGNVNSIGFLMGFGGTGGGLHWGYWGSSTELLTFAFHNFSRKTRFNAPSAGDKLTAGWHLIGVNHNGTGYDIIIDGVIATSATLDSGSTGTYSIETATSILSGTGFDSVTVMTNTAANYATEGLVDEVAIWDSALSSSDITDIYNSGTPVDLTSYSPNGWWRMGDNDGGTGTTITDQGSGGNDGTLTNGPTFSTNVPGPLTNNYSVKTDGTNDQLQLPSGLPGSGNRLGITGSAFTICFWMKITGTIPPRVNFFYNSSIQIRTRTDGFRFYTSGANKHHIHTITAGTWYFLALSCDGTNHTSYVKSASDDLSATVVGNSFTPTGYATFGPSCNANYDEFATFNSALSASDISNIYNSGVPGDLSGYATLAGHWRMGDSDGGTGTTITDEMGGEDITLANGAFIDTDIPS